MFRAIPQVDSMFLFGVSISKYLGVFWSDVLDRVWISGKLFFLFCCCGECSDLFVCCSPAMKRGFLSRVIVQQWRVLAALMRLSLHISSLIFSVSGIQFLSSFEQSLPETWDVFLPLTWALPEIAAGRLEFRGIEIYFQLCMFLPAQLSVLTLLFLQFL